MFYTFDELQEISNQGPLKSWACWITTQGDRGSYSRNQVRYATKEECDKAGAELASRWFSVIHFLAVPSEDEVNSKFENGRSVSLD